GLVLTSHLSFPAPSPPATSTLSLHDALPISRARRLRPRRGPRRQGDRRPPRFRPARRRRGRALALRSCGRRGKEHPSPGAGCSRSEEHTSELQSRFDLVCCLLLEKKKIS